MPRRLIRFLTLAGVASTLGACGSFGDRSTFAELTARCEQRGGVVVAGNSAAEGGLRCVGRTNLASASVYSGQARRTAQANAAIDRSLRRGY